MHKKVIYFDSENLKTKKQVESYLVVRINELQRMRFSNKDIFKVIFEDSYFRYNFIENINFIQLKQKYKALLK